MKNKIKEKKEFEMNEKELKQSIHFADSVESIIDLFNGIEKDGKIPALLLILGHLFIHRPVKELEDSINESIVVTNLMAVLSNKLIKKVRKRRRKQNETEI